MTLDEVKELLVDLGCGGAVVFEDPDFADAFIGADADGRAVYDLERMVHCLMEEDGVDEEGARDYIDYCTRGTMASMGDKAPVVIMWRVSDYEG